MENNGEWEVIDEGNVTSRHENSFVECRGKLYLIGGRGDRPVEEYNPDSNTWRRLSNPPFEIHHFQAVAYNGLIYIAGAMTDSERGFPFEKPVENVLIYDPEQNSWSKGPEIPQGRRRGSCGAFVYHDRLYMLGGIIEGHNTGSVTWFDRYDFSTDTWSILPDCPRGRDHFQAIVVDNRLYAIGGRDTSFHKNEKGEYEFSAFFGATIREVDVYDFTKEEYFVGKKVHKETPWRTLAERLPVGTAAGSIVSIRETIYYIGGESNQQNAHSETQCLDIHTQKWQFDAPLQTGRHGTSALEYKGSIYIASGSGGKGGGPELSSLERYRLNDS